MVASTGLNGNWIALDVAVGVGHNADGSHKSAVIDKGNLKSTVCDGTTIELHGTVGFEVKAGGIDKINLKTTVADAFTIELDAIDGLRVKSGWNWNSTISGWLSQGDILDTSSGSKVMDGITIGINGSSQLYIPDNAVTEDLHEEKYIALVSQIGTANPIAYIIQTPLVVFRSLREREPGYIR